MNEELKEDYSRVIRDPYESGWLLLIQPTRLEEDLKNLAPFEQA